MARAWSTDYLRHVTQDAESSTGQAAQGPARSAVARMTSMDSLNMQDLNKMYSLQNGMSRQRSYGSQVSEDQASSSHGAGMVRSFTLPSALHSIQENRNDSPAEYAPSSVDLPSADPTFRRQLRHQMSLDCIGSAIASATARRAGHQRTTSGLSLGYTAEEQEDVPPLPYLQDYNDHQYGGVQLDDLDDIPDDYDSLPQPTPGYLHADHQAQYNQQNGTPYSYSEHIQLHDTDYAEYEDESEDEVDLVLQAKQYESEDETSSHAPIRAQLSPSTTYSRRDNTTASFPVKSALRSAPPKSPSAPRRSQSGQLPASADDGPLSSRPASALGSSARMSFGVASPASPVKKSYTPITSPPRRNTRTLAPQNGTGTSGRSPRLPPASPASVASARSGGTAASTVRRSRPASIAESAAPANANGAISPVKRQQVERVPGPLSTPSVVRLQPLKGGMRKMASTSALRSSGM